MSVIPEPLKTVLRDYCHVEWYEVHELAEDVTKPSWKIDASFFKSQLNDAINGIGLNVEQANALTGNEFEDSEELKEWLEDIKAKVFS